MTIGRLQIVKWGKWGGFFPWPLDAPLERAYFIRKDWHSDTATIWLWWAWGWCKV